MANLTAFGEQTKTIFLNDIESHKLHLAFTVAAASTIFKGQPVKLNAVGAIIAAIGDGTDAHAIIGYSIQDAVAGDICTVGVRGYAVIYARAETALVPGPVFYSGQDSVEGEYGIYDDTAVTAANMNGWSLDVANALHDEIRVLLK
jgi:hypothetical protein